MKTLVRIMPGILLMDEILHYLGALKYYNFLGL